MEVLRSDLKSEMGFLMQQEGGKTSKDQEASKMNKTLKRKGERFSIDAS